MLLLSCKAQCLLISFVVWKSMCIVLSWVCPLLSCFHIALIVHTSTGIRVTTCLEKPRNVREFEVCQEVSGKTIFLGENCFLTFTFWATSVFCRLLRACFLCCFRFIKSWWKFLWNMHQLLYQRKAYSSVLEASCTQSTSLVNSDWPKVRELIPQN